MCSSHKLEGMFRFHHKGSGASCSVPAQASSLAPIFNFSKDKYALDISADSSADEVEEFLESFGSSNSETESESNTEEVVGEVTQRSELTLAPSSAAVERVFSLLRENFDKHSHAALIDYLCVSLMLRYNGRELTV